VLKERLQRRLSALSIDYRARTCRIRTPRFMCCPSSVPSSVLETRFRKSPRKFHICLRVHRN